MFNIVLVEPEIPQNTGNIARTCAATGSKLHIIKPMGFEIDDKKLKRAGLDYWHLLGVQYYEGIEDFYNKNPDAKCYYASTKAINTYSDVKYSDGDYIFFGKETKGLPEELLYKNEKSCIRIPMIDEARSLNLSNAVAIVVYEALRQNSFFELKNRGELTKYNWKGTENNG
ncbi:MAG: tRNA (uridine(34)/cytosine(34)/5-carboxymethylaminomethyluridine(34)-2'-O)-methyltransferase TrmL [Clostridia bacterium]|nr:tRNA (uridine(34)/cytosine(34)/5-carboxymethylaminomethyluridine(34)-2'-O)-methyltransferase TrmL [Clostridia bacterium]